ncbi:MAG TPA: T9SS type A sorting domain-containing protein [Candidatus Eisenbacteria bacterium]|nr:T9SS type A sorting domain-containing protein [Candidatus Eisenbacteria bacterium]
MTTPRLLRQCTLALIMAACVAAPAGAETQETAARAARLKQAQIRFMMRGVQRELTERRREAAEQRARIAELRRQGRKISHRELERLERAEAGRKARPAPLAEPPDPPMLGTSAQQAPASVTAIATNQRVNNRATDTAICGSPPCSGLPWSGQCEVSIAAHGNNLLAAWNDGEGFVTNNQTQGFAYSTNNGTSWTDPGVPPTTGGVGTWTSDPVVTVNEKTGAFYYAALCEPTASTNGIAVVKGTFSGGAFVWQTPRVVVQGSYNSVVFDKEWLSADSLTGNLYLIYSRFSAVGGNITSNRIDFQYTSLDNAFPWAAAVTLSATGDAGLVQGARTAVGPAGEVWAAWNAIGQNPPYSDSMRVRRISGGGAIVGSQVTAVTQFTNFGSGGPGFNRGLGFAFPGLAVDRSTGPRRGRVYMTWNESVNFYDDPIGNTGTTAESEPNDAPGTADAFTMGRILTGTMSSGTDLDYWSFAGVQGQTIICSIDANPTGAPSPNLDATFRLFCTDGGTRLAFSESGVGGTGLIVFTIPANGNYTLRVASTSPDGITPPGTGPYQVETGLNGVVTERGRDHRDVFTSYSDVVGTWSAPVRVNGEAARYDDWLPEIAVASNGDVYTAWYDWRDAPASLCTGASMVYLSRSNNGTTSWPDGSPVTTNISPWTTAYSNIAPNQGDYIALYANQNAAYTCWSDGRDGDPDVYMAAVSLGFTAVQVSLAGTYAETGLVRLTWYASGDEPIVGTVYRRTGDQAWTDLGRAVPDGTGRIVFEDRAVSPGTRYFYRLGFHDGSAESFTAEVAVDVPLAVIPELAIQNVRPNPSEREMWVSFSLPAGETARLELLDISGRRVRERSVSGAGQQMVDLSAGGPRLTPGIYLVRLTQGKRSVVTRASVVR